MLDDGNAGRQQQGVGRPAAVVGVIDVDRVDADQRRAVGDQPGGAGPGEEVRPLGVSGGAEPGVVARSDRTIRGRASD